MEMQNDVVQEQQTASAPKLFVNNKCRKPGQRKATCWYDELQR